MDPLPTPRYFPPPQIASRDGVVLVGGQLTTEWLLDAYRHGIFPWPVEGGELVWWSLSPRAVLPLDQLHVSRRLRQTLSSGRFQVTSDTAFVEVLHGCATAGDRRGATWLTDEMRDAYLELHRLGHAHSVEVWRDGQLAGGIYGVALGGMFAGESMFHYVRDASKVALVTLAQHLRHRGYGLLDVQQWTPHTAQFGVVEIPRRVFLRQLAIEVDRNLSFGHVDQQ